MKKFLYGLGAAILTAGGALAYGLAQDPPKDPRLRVTEQEAIENIEFGGIRFIPKTTVFTPSITVRMHTRAA